MQRVILLFVTSTVLFYTLPLAGKAILVGAVFAAAFSGDESLTFLRAKCAESVALLAQKSKELTKELTGKIRNQ